MDENTLFSVEWYGREGDYCMYICCYCCLCMIIRQYYIWLSNMASTFDCFGLSSKTNIIFALVALFASFSLIFVVVRMQYIEKYCPKDPNKQKRIILPPRVARLQ